MSMIALVATAAVAAVVDIEEEHMVVFDCLREGFSEDVCNAVRADCRGLSNDNPFFCYRDTHPSGKDTQNDILLAYYAQVRTGVLKNVLDGTRTESVVGAPLTYVGSARETAPSFPRPEPWETNPTPGIYAVALCTSPKCDASCKGAFCAHRCSGFECGVGCHGDLCAAICSGAQCGAASRGRHSALDCGQTVVNGATECGVGCDGGACASGCYGAGCGAMCTGRYCATYCGVDKENPAVSVGCGAHCVGHNCAYDCKGLGCGVGARETADDEFTTTCGDYLYSGHCGTLTELAGLRCTWTGSECVNDPDDSAILQVSIGLAAATGAVAGAAVIV